MNQKSKIFESQNLKILAKNKRGQDEIGFLLFVLVFQAFLVLMLGFLPTYSPDDVESKNINNVFFDFGSIISNIKVLGWGNTILFAPAGIVLVFILVRLARG